MVTNVKLHWYISRFKDLFIFESRTDGFVSFQSLIGGSGKFLWPADDLDISFKSPRLADRDAFVVFGSFCSKVANAYGDFRTWVLRD